MIQIIFSFVILSLSGTQVLSQLYGRSKDCDVTPYRINLPAISQYIYSWNCICLDGKNKVPFSYSAARGSGNPINETSNVELASMIQCFSEGYNFHNFKEICIRDPTEYAKVAIPVVEHCMKLFVSKSVPSVQMTYTRQYCASEFSQLRDVNIDNVVAGIWFCHCPQEQWKHIGVPTPVISDGRSAFLVGTPDKFPLKRPDTMDYIEECVLQYKYRMDSACQMTDFDAGHFRDMARITWRHCCESANTFINANLNCDDILSNPLA